MYACLVKTVGLFWKNGRKDKEKKMSDVSDPAPLSVTQVERYHNEGYLMVPNLLSPSEIDEFLKAEEQRDTSGPGSLQNHNQEDHWAHMVRHPRVVPIVRQLLAAPPLIVQSMFMAKTPAGGTGVALHQDTHYIRNEPNTLMACWIALSDTDEKNGGLCVVPGSNQKGLYDFDRVRDPDEHAAWEKIYPMRSRDGSQWDETMFSFDIVGLEPEEILYLKVPSGAGVFFTGMTIHGSYANRSDDRPRLAFATHYIAQGTWIDRVDLQEVTPVDEVKA